MRQFFLTIFVLLTLSVCSNACPSKKEANDCFFKTADSNHDNQVSRSELEKSIYPRLGWFTRAAFKIFGGIDRILTDCDENKDGILTKEESMRMDNCLDSCFKRSKTFSTFECKRT
jgi:hypothetical protein